jgi:tRNA(Arg) A34 adenosine deaminase TadA
VAEVGGGAAEHEAFMRLALDEARRAEEQGEVPIGAVLVVEGKVVATGRNQPIAARDPTAHAEVLALRAGASTLDNYRLAGSTLYVTLEPCLMCVGAIVHARVATLVYGAADLKGGAVHSILRVDELGLNHSFDVVDGVLADECVKLLVDFFRSRRGSLA